MKRREFSTLVSSTAACWPLVAFAQQSERVGRIGVLAVGGLYADDLDLVAITECTVLMVPHNRRSADIQFPRV